MCGRSFSSFAHLVFPFLKLGVHLIVRHGVPALGPFPILALIRRFRLGVPRAHANRVFLPMGVVIISYVADNVLLLPPALLLPKQVLLLPLLSGALSSFDVLQLEFHGQSDLGDPRAERNRRAFTHPTFVVSVPSLAVDGPTSLCVDFFSNGQKLVPTRQLGWGQIIPGSCVCMFGGLEKGERKEISMVCANNSLESRYLRARRAHTRHLHAN